MARVTVFVDDAVRGALPPVCVRTGSPATTHAAVDSRVGGASPLAVLLIFLGPIGWIALLVLGGRSETLVARLPVSDAVEHLWERWRRVRLAAAAAVVAGLALLAVTAGSPGWMRVSLLVAGAGFAGTVFAGVRLWLCGVGVDLDASRRWVTLRGVHPTFVEGVLRREAGQREGALV
jgi:hypothetical protein